MSFQPSLGQNLRYTYIEKQPRKKNAKENINIITNQLSCLFS